MQSRKEDVFKVYGEEKSSKQIVWMGSKSNICQKA
jgi:hypothetical protein